MAFRRLSLLIGNRWIMYQSIDIFSNKLLKSSGALEMSFHNFHFYILQYFFTAPTWLSISNDFGIQLSILLNILSEHYRSERPQHGPIRGQFSSHVISLDQSEASSPPSSLEQNYILHFIRNYQKIKSSALFLGLNARFTHNTSTMNQSEASFQVAWSVWTNQRPGFRSRDQSGPIRCLQPSLFPQK